MNWTFATEQFQASSPQKITLTGSFLNCWNIYPSLMHLWPGIITQYHMYALPYLHHHIRCFGLAMKMLKFHAAIDINVLLSAMTYEHKVKLCQCNAPIGS